MNATAWLVWTLALFVACCVRPVSAKEGYSLLTTEEVAALKESLKGGVNVPSSLTQASDDELWDYVPPGTLKRAWCLKAYGWPRGREPTVGA